MIVTYTYGSVQTAVDAMRVGAYDYLAKPVNLDNLEMLIARGLEQRRLRRENAELRRLLDKRYGFEGIVGTSWRSWSASSSPCGRWHWHAPRSCSPARAVPARNCWRTPCTG